MPPEKSKKSPASPPQTVGIRAKTIRAENIVDGVQIQNASPETADSLIQLAKNIQRGSITAEDIKARNIVTGLQYIADPKTATPDALKKEVTALKARIVKAVEKGEIPDKDDAEDLKEALTKTEKELASPSPGGKRIIRSLKTVSEILNESAETLKTAGTLQAQAIKLAPTAAMVYSIAKMLFGV